MNIYYYALLLIFLSQVLTKPPNTRNNNKQLVTAPTVTKYEHVQNVSQPRQTFRRLHKVIKSKKSKPAKSRSPVGKKRFRKKLKENAKSDPKVMKISTGNRRTRKKAKRKRKIKSKGLANDVMPQDASVSEKKVRTKEKSLTGVPTSKKKKTGKRLLHKVRKRRKKVPSSQRRKKMRSGKPRLLKKSKNEKSSNDVLRNQNITRKEQVVVNLNAERESQQMDQALPDIDKIPSKVVSQSKENLTLATESGNTNIVEENKIYSTETTLKLIIPQSYLSTTKRVFNYQPSRTTPKAKDNDDKSDIADLKKIQEEYDRNITKFRNYYRKHKQPPKITTTMSPAELDELEEKLRLDKNYARKIPDMCSKHYQMAKRWSKQLMGGVEFPDCTPDGKYERTQCYIWAGCKCVDPNTGYEVPGKCWKPSKHEQEEMKRKEEEAEMEKHDKRTRSILHNTCILPDEKCALFDDIFAANSDIPIKVIKTHNERTNSVYNTAGRSRQEIEERAFQILKNVRDESRFCSHFVDQFPFLSRYVHKYTETCRRTFERFKTARWFTPFDWKESALRALSENG